MTDFTFPAAAAIVGFISFLICAFRLAMSKGRSAGNATGFMASDITRLPLEEDASKRREPEFHTLVENLPDFIARFDREIRYTYVNSALTEICGVPFESFIGKTISEISPCLSDEQIRTATESIRQVFERGIPLSFEASFNMPQGERIFEFRYIPERAENGKVTGVIGVGRDITERRRIEAQLRESEAVYSSVITAMAEGVVFQAANGAIITVNPAAERIRGRSAEHVLGRISDDPCRQAVHEDGSPFRRELHPAMITLRTGEPQSNVVMGIRRPDGTLAWISMNSQPLHFAGESAPYAVVTTFHDITERKRAEEALQANQRKLSEMAVELSLAEERERRRIAAELHDQIGQTLLLAKIKFGALATTLTSIENWSAVEEIRRLLDQAINDVRSLTQQLYPPMLIGAGLGPSLEWLGRRMEHDYGLRVEFVDDKCAKPLTEELRSVVYQSARELLINVAKHAEADSARLFIGRDGQMLKLVVEDRGVGFELPVDSANWGGENGFGLFSIRERIRYLGGRMTIESEPGNGTRVVLWAPLTVEALVRTVPAGEEHIDTGFQMNIIPRQEYSCTSR